MDSVFWRVVEYLVLVLVAVVPLAMLVLAIRERRLRRLERQAESELGTERVQRIRDRATELNRQRELEESERLVLRKALRERA